MPFKLSPTLLILACAIAQAQSGSGASAVSERDFLGEVPVVLSVSRLAQPLDEAPGAVTILDRQFIRMSGARDVADLLRMVPGFQSTTSFETDAPMATYHGRVDDWANRIQVMVDGRSVYSAHKQGSAGLGWLTLAMDDIDRIEILRGSNSATYGARAFLGVVNIVSRPLRDISGPSAFVNVGDNGVADTGVRLGWGEEDKLFGLSADTREDEGLRGAYGRNRVQRLNLSAQLATGPGQELYLKAGALGVDAGRGTVGDNEGNNAHMRFMGSQYVQLDWRRALDEDTDLQVSASRTEVTVRDSFPYLKAGIYLGTPIDSSGRDVNSVLSVQGTHRWSPDLRTVVGTELRAEEVVSSAYFDNRGRVTSDFYRVFGTAEWRLAPEWILNAGALAERSDIGGNAVSPRLMLNWHVATGHTLRAGVSNAFRPPSAYEKYAAVQYRDINGGNPTGYYTLNQGVLGPEKLHTEELGYYMNLPRLRVDADIRLFQEHVRDGIAHTENWTVGTNPEQYLGLENYDISGVEYQVSWKPSPSTYLMLGGAWTDIRVNSSVGDQTRFRTTYSAPKYAGSVALMQELGAGWSMAVMYQQSNDMSLMSNEKVNGQYVLYRTQRTDMRLAKALRSGKHKGELAFTVQNLDQPYRDGNSKFFFDRRAFVSLRMDY